MSYTVLAYQRDGDEVVERKTAGINKKADAVAAALQEVDAGADAATIHQTKNRKRQQIAAIDADGNMSKTSEAPAIADDTTTREDSTTMTKATTTKQTSKKQGNGETGPDAYRAAFEEYVTGKRKSAPNTNQIRDKYQISADDAKAIREEVKQKHGKAKPKAATKPAAAKAATKAEPKQTVKAGKYTVEIEDELDTDAPASILNDGDGELVLEAIRLLVEQREREVAEAKDRLDTAKSLAKRTSAATA